MNLRIAITAIMLFVVQQTYSQDKKYSLLECRKLAIEQNKRMKAAQFNIDAAKAQSQSVIASAKPAIDGSAMGVHLGKPIGGALNGAIPDFFGSTTLTGTIPIYAGGKLQNGKAAAAKGVEISETQKKLTASEVELNVDKAYWQVIQVKERIKVANQYRDMLQALEKDLKNAFDAGLIYKNDLLRVQVNLNEANLNIQKAEDGLLLARLSLAQVIGLAGQSDFIITDSLAGNFDELKNPSILSVSAGRPELLIMKKSIEAEEFQKKILQGDRRPTFGLSVSGITSVGKGVNIKDGSNFMGSYYALANISIPVFDWGRKSNRVKEQTFKIASQQQQLEEAREMVNLEIQSAYLQLNQASKKIKLSDLSLKQASENLRITQDRFKAGTVIGKDVSEAQAIWQQAYNETIDARIEYRINEAILKKAIGESAQ
ncbi:TolC family protein [Pedobacter sp. GR22-10]|uniref:TolC family protein n=1 Tax=Pedobacter sp. GR22-10 TaxID=2994472 RepID=UPI002247024A|nr:TolC family protein [Pedobacter sp. GR22-10]MCX2429647.1 TolC family protein [Pedobacter sp. GR22-10]